MNANFGILDPLAKRVKGKRNPLRGHALSARSQTLDRLIADRYELRN